MNVAKVSDCCKDKRLVQDELTDKTEKKTYYEVKNSEHNDCDDDKDEWLRKKKNVKRFIVVCWLFTSVWMND